MDGFLSDNLFYQGFATVLFKIFDCIVFFKILSDIFLSVLHLGVVVNTFDFTFGVQHI